jgi:hypothetical protein
VAGGVVERLRELFFLGADHVADVAADGRFVVPLAAALDRLEEVAVVERLVVVDDHLDQRGLAGGERDDVPAFDEPDVALVGAADDLLAAQDLEKLGVEAALVQKEGEASRATLFGSVAAAHGIHALSRRGCASSVGGDSMARIWPPRIPSTLVL